MAEARGGSRSVLIYLDLDKFKTINDTLGHSIGNLALVHAVRLMRENLRASDLLARVGGDEFAALLDGADLATGLDIAERLRRGIECCPFAVAGRSFSLSLSSGVALVDGDLSPAAVLARADEAMYVAKLRGRNQVVVAGSTGEVVAPVRTSTPGVAQLHAPLVSVLLDLGAQGALGSYTSALAFDQVGWADVCLLGAAFGSVALVVWIGELATASRSGRSPRQA